jgi:hypothetical protein
MPDPITITVGSFITALVGGFAGALYTNARADARDDKKLSHDAEQKERDRLLSLKKDIYYSVVGDFARFQVVLSTLADTPLTALQVGIPSAEFAANYARVELIAPLPLVTEVQKVSQELRDTFLPLMLERAKFQMKTDRLNETGMMFQEHMVAWNAHNREHSEFRVRCMRGALKLRKSLIPLVREIRREMDVSVDMSAFGKLLESDIAHAEAATDRFQSQLFGDEAQNP